MTYETTEEHTKRIEKEESLLDCLSGLFCDKIITDRGEWTDREVDAYNDGVMRAREEVIKYLNNQQINQKKELLV